MKRLPAEVALLVLGLATFACGDDDDGPDMTNDPDDAPLAEIDRFSEAAGTLMVRDGENGLPAAGAPIDFDQGPFVTQGLGPDGQVVRYYNFDVQPTVPAPIYAFFRESTDEPVEGQLNVVDVIPGATGYNDFWQVVRVLVPDDYVANQVTSASEIFAADFELEDVDAIVNCPIVPEGSTATRRLVGTDTGLTRGWYRGEVVHYFNFAERALSTDGGAVPTAPIYVSFNINPDEEGGGPPSGFQTEAAGEQTHNVVGAIPSQAGYSPLWSVNVYDNASFDQVGDLASAEEATILATGVANVNCPIVAVE
jgi:hypothetical protein